MFYHPSLSLSIQCYPGASNMFVYTLRGHLLMLTLLIAEINSEARQRGRSDLSSSTVSHWGYKLFKCSCSIQEQNCCHRGAFYLGVLLSALEAKAPDVLVWFPFGFPMHSMLHKTKRKDKVLRYSQQKKEDLICEKITSCINTYSVSCIAHRVPCFPVTWSNLLTTEEKSKSSINTSSPPSFPSLSVSFWDTVSRDWKPRGVSCDPGLIWPMTSLRGGGQGQGGEGAVTSRADLLLPAVTSVWLRPANEDVIRSVSSAWHKLNCQRNWFNLFPPALKMNNQEVHTI